MAWQIVDKVLAAEIGGPAGRKLVAVVLADAAEKDGRRAYPGEERLARRSGLSSRRVRGHIEALLADGIIRQTRRGHTKQRAEFDFNMARLAELTKSTDDTEQVATPPKQADVRVRQSDRKRRTSVSASPPKRRTPVTKEADADVRPPGPERSKELAPASPDAGDPETLLGPELPSHKAVTGTLVEVCGYNPDRMTQTEWGRARKAATILRKVPEVSVAEIKARAARYAQVYPNAAITPTAIAAQWSNLEGKVACRCWSGAGGVHSRDCPKFATVSERCPVCDMTEEGWSARAREIHLEDEHGVLPGLHPAGGTDTDALKEEAR
jgi:hypothetical protein